MILISEARQRNRRVTQTNSWEESFASKPEWLEQCWSYGTPTC